MLKDYKRDRKCLQKTRHNKIYIKLQEFDGQIKQITHSEEKNKLNGMLQDGKNYPKST